MGMVFYATCDGCGNYRIVEVIFNRRLCYDCTQEFNEWLKYRKQIDKTVRKEIKNDTRR